MIYDIVKFIFRFAMKTLKGNQLKIITSQRSRLIISTENSNKNVTTHNYYSIYEFMNLSIYSKIRYF